MVPVCQYIHSGLLMMAAWQHKAFNQGPVLWRPTTVKWRQFSQSNRHSTFGTRQTQYHEALPSSGNMHQTSLCRSTMMVALHDTGFVKCRWWNDGWTVKSVITRGLSASMTPAPGFLAVIRRIIELVSQGNLVWFIFSLVINWSPWIWEGVGVRWTYC